jgi:hypothetical protein
MALKLAGRVRIVGAMIDPRRESCRRDHLIVGQYLAGQVWLRGLDCNRTSSPSSIHSLLLSGVQIDKHIGSDSMTTESRIAGMAPEAPRTEWLTTRRDGTQVPSSATNRFNAERSGSRFGIARALCEESKKIEGLTARCESRQESLCGISA